MSNCSYLVPDDFQQRNLELIQSIRKYLHNDESKFNEFKNYSAQFRQVTPIDQGVARVLRNIKR